jgi:hypothetical protein
MPRLLINCPPLPSLVSLLFDTPTSHIRLLNLVNVLFGLSHPAAAGELGLSHPAAAGELGPCASSHPAAAAAGQLGLLVRGGHGTEAEGGAGAAAHRSRHICKLTLQGWEAIRVRRGTAHASPICIEVKCRG